jgi:hypothetical protein
MSRLVSRVAGHSKCEWRTFGDSRWSSKIRSTSPVSLVDLLDDTAHKWPGNTPTYTFAPSAPSQNRLWLGLHLKWRDVIPFGYILDGLLRRIEFSRDSVHSAGRRLAFRKWS